MPDPVLVELLRRGNVAVVRSTATGAVELLVDHVGALPFDAAEWRWLVHCAAPVALRELAAIEAEAERAGRAPAQATLAIDA
jgi:hypothetical protein